MLNNQLLHVGQEGSYTCSRRLEFHLLFVHRHRKSQKCFLLYCSTWNNIKENISGFSYDDEQTKDGILTVLNKYNYLLDPHGAVGYLALDEYQKKNPDTKGVIFETAHPSKFINDVENIIQKEVSIPERLSILKDKTKVSITIGTAFSPFKDYLLSNY